MYNNNYLYKYLFPILLLVSGTIIYPIYLINIYPSFGYAYFKIFTLSTLSLLSLSFILFNIKKNNFLLFLKKDLFLTIFLFSTISIIHFCAYETYRLNDFGFSLIWVTIPLLVFINSNIFKKILPYYLLFLWLLDLSHSFFQGSEKVGIAGNRNWHAIFLIVLIISSIYLIKIIINYKFLRKARIYLYLKIFILSIFAVLWSYSFYIIHLCRSRGAILSIILSLFLLSVIYIKSKFTTDRNTQEKSKLFLNNKRIYFLTFSFIFLIIAVALFYKLNSSTNLDKSQTFENKISLHTNKTYMQIEEAFNEDVRIPLWAGTLNLIINNALLGVGATKFESSFAQYRPISYFLKPNTATRTNHPHNVILYILSCYGIPGFVFWAILCIYPMIYCFFKFNYLDLIEKLSFFAYFCLFISSCFDLTLYIWPTLFIALLFLGILWNATWRYENNDIIKSNNNLFLKLLFYTAGFSVLISCLINVYSETVGSYNVRSGFYYETQNKKNIAMNYYQKGLSYTKPNRFVYKAALIALNHMQNPTLALKLFSYYKFLPTNNYAHNNAFIALCLMQKGQFKAAIPYLYKEVINYPISTGAWYRLYFTQNSLGQKKLAQFSYKNMLTTLKYKNLPKSALKLLLSNPDYDKHPHKIPEIYFK